MLRTEENRVRGRSFEDVFLFEAKHQGLYARKNHLSARVIPGGRMFLVKGQLDFTVVAPGGRVGFFDMKSFAADFFSYSRIDAPQLAQAVLFNELLVPAGFVIWFIPTRRVAYFTGLQIDCKGPGARFTFDEGVDLGSLEAIDLKPLFQEVPARDEYAKNQKH